MKEMEMSKKYENTFYQGYFLKYRVMNGIIIWDCWVIVSKFKVATLGFSFFVLSLFKKTKFLFFKMGWFGKLSHTDRHIGTFLQHWLCTFSQVVSCLIARLTVINIAQLTVLFCSCPLFCNCPLADL